MFLMGLNANDARLMHRFEHDQPPFYYTSELIYL